MKRLNDFINENLQINESFLLMALCGAVACHFAVKGLKSINKHMNNFWNWALEGDSLTNENKINQLSNFISEDKNEKIDKNNIQPMQIPNEKVLDKLMEKLKADAKKKKGFYVFDKLFQENPELKTLNKAPYFANYVVFMSPGSNDDEDEKPNFYGMLGFSLKYWKVVAKKGKNDNIKSKAAELKKYINIFAVQTDSKYAKQGLFELYIEQMKKAVKEAKMDGLTIKYSNDDIAKVFEKSGFSKINDLDGYMKLDIKK